MTTIQNLHTYLSDSQNYHDLLSLINCVDRNMNEPLDITPEETVFVIRSEYSISGETEFYFSEFIIRDQSGEFYAVNISDDYRLSQAEPITIYPVIPQEETVTYYVRKPEPVESE